MADGSGRATAEQFIVGAQKSTNHLKALLAKLLPATPRGRHGDGKERSASAVDALLSDITDSLSQALASLQLGSSGGQRPPAQSSIAGGRRSSAPRRSGQRIRTDAVCRMIVLQTGVHDSYTWRKYGQKDIHGTRFPRSYFKCGRKPSCPAKKQVQQSDADPAKLEITYIDAHTCHDPPPPPSLLTPDPMISSASGDLMNTAAQLATSASLPAAPRHQAGRASSPSSSLHHVPHDPTIGSIVSRTTGLPQVAAGRAAALPGARYDLVPDDDDDDMPSLEEQERDELLHIPSPACSQSELLPAETASKLSPQGSPVPMGHMLACHDDCDFAVPEL